MILFVWLIGCWTWAGFSMREWDIPRPQTFALTSPVILPLIPFFLGFEWFLSKVGPNHG